MNLVETIQDKCAKGFEISFFTYQGFLRVTVRTFVSAASFGFEIPEGYVEALILNETKIIQKINDLCDEQDRAFASNLPVGA